MTETQPRSPFSRPWFIASAGVVGVIILAAIVVLGTSIVAGGNDDTSTAPTPSTSESAPPAASAEPTESPADASVCGLDDFESESSLSAAPAIDWELVGTVAAPTDPEGAGPGVIDSDGFRSCFSHTAEGALFAAVNFIAIGTDASIGPRLIELVAPGPGRDALQDEQSSNGTSSLRAQVGGYKVASYSSSSATIDVALNYSTGKLISLPLKLVWAEGDWKVEMTAEGELPLAPAPISNLGGYTPWSGA